MTHARPAAPFLLAVVLLALLMPGLAQAACREDAVDLRGPWGQARFAVEIADTPASRNQGLMNRPSLPSGAGMLFLYDTPGRAVFWMRNTLIPLDMIFVGPDGVVSHVHHRAVPLDETPIDGGSGVLAVLEINGGLSEAFGIAPGTELRHPRLPQDRAAWPC